MPPFIIVDNMKRLSELNVIEDDFVVTMKAISEEFPELEGLIRSRGFVVVLPTDHDIDTPPIDIFTYEIKRWGEGVSLPGEKYRGNVIKMVMETLNNYVSVAPQARRLTNFSESAIAEYMDLDVAPDLTLAGLLLDPSQAGDTDVFQSACAMLYADMPSFYAEKIADFGMSAGTAFRYASRRSAPIPFMRPMVVERLLNGVKGQAVPQPEPV